MENPEDQILDETGAPVDLKKLSKGQLKKLKEKEKKRKEDEAAAAAAAEAEAKKKTESEQNGAAQPSEPQDQASGANDAQDDEEQGENKDGTKKELSKGQLKKLKQKTKDKKDEPEVAAKVEEKKEEEEDGGKDDKKKKGGKKVSAVAKLAQQRLEEQKKREEELKKLEDEIRQKEEEERRKQEEEEKRLREIEEEKKRKKEEKIQKLKDEGKFQTKKEREKEIALQRRREELIAAGIISADQFASSNTGGEKKSTVVRTKKPKQKKEETQTKTEEQNGKEDDNGEHEEPAAEKNTEDADGWEAQAEEVKAEEPKGTKADDDEVEDWEKFEEVSQPKTETAKPAGAKKPKEAKSEKSKPEEPVKTEEKSKTTEKTAPTQKATEEKPKETVEAKPKTGAKEEPKPSAAPKEEVKTNGPVDSVRSPIVCILGHVDTGKTKLLDKMRNTNVQEGEAGGITQQIGATFFPYEKIRDESAKVQGHYPFEVQVPGLLIIDTPGHESFSNLRSRGSGLCDIAILVVDIMHGLEKQTLESIELLRFRKTPFVIALNKIDRLYGWKAKPDISSHVSLKKQDKSVQLEFRDRSKAIMTELTEKGFNVALYYENPDPNSYVSIIPTSAHTGEGVPDLISVAVNLTQKRLKKKISKKDEFKCTVLEVKVIEGLGASIDVMLVDGTLKEGDQIALAGYDGPIVTHVRALLTPHPMKEMRVKNEYIHHKTISGAMGIKISANDLDKALAGSELYVVKNDEEIEDCKKLLIDEITKVKKSIRLVEEGVLVAASTLGSLEALLQFLKTSSIPVAAISIGPVSKAEIIKAMKPLQITEGEIKKEFATILAFDVKILPDAKDLAEQEGVKIFTANIIYHLFDHFTAYMNDIREEKKRNEGKLAVFPCILKPVAFFNMKDPIVMGLDVVEGQLRIGTPICVAEKGKLRIGTIESMEKEHKPVQVARPSDGSIAVKFKGDSTIMAGRHFELKDKLISIVSRESIDSLKKYFRDEMSKADWELVKKLKPVFGVI